MSTVLSPVLVQRFCDNNGNPLFGGQLFSYEAGTTTPLATYTDSTGVTQNTNPVILNARGEANVWIPANTAYKFVLQDSSGNTIWTVDNVVQSQLVSLYGGVDTGITNAYVLTFDAPWSTLANGIVIYWVPSHTNGSASTLNVNGLGALSIVNPNGNALSAGQITSGQPAVVMYYNGSWVLTNGSSIATLSCTALFALGEVQLGASGKVLEGWGQTAAGWVDMAPDYGTFTPNWTGFSAAPVGDLSWSKMGSVVCLYVDSSNAYTGTSNANSMAITNLPAEITPQVLNAYISVPCAGLWDNGSAGGIGLANVQQSGVVTFGLAKANLSTGAIGAYTTSFTPSGTKGWGGAIVYSIH